MDIVKKFEIITVSVFWKKFVKDQFSKIYLTILIRIPFFEFINGVFMKITEFPWRFLDCFFTSKNSKYYY